MSELFSWSQDSSLAPDVAKFYPRFCDHLSEEQFQTIRASFEQNATRLQEFHHLVDTSKFVRELFIANPEVLINLISNNTLEVCLTEEHYRQILRPQQDADESSFNILLRKQRNLAMARIIWRDFNKLCTLEETTAELSILAGSAIQSALDFHFAQLQKKHGTPLSKDGEPQGLLVLGMGKLGAFELNLSSDIDLIFAYGSSGQTDNPDRCLDNQEFFSRLGKKIIASLDNQTADGFVFRVDMRLRPYGQSGALVCNFASLEDYYQTQGREWERYAMIKARVVASNANDTHEELLMGMLREFTYRRYVDFSVIDALRKLKQMIVQEVHRRQLGDDVKLGSGGIREVEFIAQTFQLVRGGRNAELQDNRLLHILPRLEELGALPEGRAQLLIDAYRFLRDSEHAIQGYEDQQTQKLPQDEQQQAKIAAVMGFDNWQDYYQTLEKHRSVVSTEFATVIAAPEDDEATPDGSEEWSPLWLGLQNDEACIEQLASSGHENPQRSLSLLHELRDNTAARAIHSSGRERIDQFIPLLLASLSQTPQPTETLDRILKLVESGRATQRIHLTSNRKSKRPKATGSLNFSEPLDCQSIGRTPRVAGRTARPAQPLSTPL